MCVLANLEHLSILFCAVLWAAAPGLVAVLPMWDSSLNYSELVLLMLLNPVQVICELECSLAFY